MGVIGKVQSMEYGREYGRAWRRNPFVSFHWLLALLIASVLLPMPAQAAKPATRQGVGRVIVALGDSLTAGYGLKPGESFPAQLEAALRRKGLAVRVVNAGVSGDTTAQSLARVDWLLAGMKGTPDLAIVALGANDMLRGLPPQEAARNLAAIIGKFRARKIPVLLAGMLAAPNMGKEYARSFNAIYPDLAKRHHVALYPFYLKGVAGEPRLLLADGKHPNRAGVAVMVRNMLPAVEKALD